MNQINVKYEAETEISDADAFEELIRSRIEQHIRSIHEVPVQDVSLEIAVTRFVVKSNEGEITFRLSGTANGNPIEQKLIVGSDHHIGMDSSEPTRELTKLAITNCFIFIRNVFWQSEFTRVVGSRRINDRARRAFDDAMAEVRIAIDSALDRPKTNGLGIWKSTLKQSFLFGFIAAVICGICFWLNGENAADSFRAGFGAILIPICVFGIRIAWGLIRLPDQFYLSERPGRKLVKLIGVKNILTIRFVAAFMMILSLALVSAGVYWLFFE